MRPLRVQVAKRNRRPRPGVLAQVWLRLPLLKGGNSHVRQSWHYLRCMVVADLGVAIPLREPAGGALWGSEVNGLSGVEMLRAFVEHRLPDPPVTRLAGLRPSEVGLGSASASMPASPWWQSGEVFSSPARWHSSLICRWALQCSPARRPDGG
jgi:hypothetical protein